MCNVELKNFFNVNTENEEKPTYGEISWLQKIRRSIAEQKRLLHW
jgi:hypothetical protein